MNLAVVQRKFAHVADMARPLGQSPKDRGGKHSEEQTNRDDAIQGNAPGVGEDVLNHGRRESVTGAVGFEALMSVPKRCK